MVLCREGSFRTIFPWKSGKRRGVNWFEKNSALFSGEINTRYPWILRNSQNLQKIKEISKISKISLKFPNIPNNSQKFQNPNEIPKNSQKFPKIPRNSQKFPKSPRNSQKFPENFQKFTEKFQRNFLKLLKKFPEVRKEIAKSWTTFGGEKVKERNQIHNQIGQNFRSLKHHIPASPSIPCSFV